MHRTDGALFIARYESRNFEFEGCGRSEAAAIDVLKQGLRAHAEQCGLEPEWWWRDLYGSEREASEEPGFFRIRQLQEGGAYRDGEEIPAPGSRAPEHMPPGESMSGGSFYVLFVAGALPGKPTRVDGPFPEWNAADAARERHERAGAWAIILEEALTP